VPARFVRPDVASDEGGLWAMMDRQETRLRRSPFLIRNRALHDYVQSIACRLGRAHCPDIRVYLLETPFFNASMAPNGMMEVLSGLMLRVENEAQLAAVLGHEIGHYLERHALQRLRDLESASAFSQFLGLFGAVGALGQLGVAASMFSYSRDQERAADRIGVLLMRKAGYDASEAGKVWSNLLAEFKARPEGNSELSTTLFATHPGIEERLETLTALAKENAGGVKNAKDWNAHVKKFRKEWLREEIRRRHPEESIVLLTRMIAASPEQSELFQARGEVYRLRAGAGDLDLAVSDFRAAVAAGNEPPETHRGLGLIYRLRRDMVGARASFQRYLEMAPNAPDEPLIRSYIEEAVK